LGQLLEESGENDILQRLDVASGLWGTLEMGKNGLKLARDSERVEILLDGLVESLELWRDVLEDASLELRSSAKKTGQYATH
jgi:hypothetical protein